MSILDDTFVVIGHGAFSKVKLGRKEDGTFFGKNSSILNYYAFMTKPISFLDQYLYLCYIYGSSQDHSKEYGVRRENGF